MSWNDSGSGSSMAPIAVSELAVPEVTETELTDPPHGELSEKTPIDSPEAPESLNPEGMKTSDTSVEARPQPVARVRLEKRFGGADDRKEAQALPGPLETPAVFNSFLSLLQQPTEPFEVGLQSDLGTCRKMPPEFLYQPQGGTVCSLHGTVNHAQSLGCSVLEPAKHQDLLFPRNFSFTYHPKEQAVKSGFYALTKPAQESRVWVKLEGQALQNPVVPAKRGRGRRHQLCPQHRVLSDIQNLAGSKVATGVNTYRDKVMAESLERRERHNNMERDRRQRIRKCCDELNTLVPFCNIETDKATTLQWTTVFLKYIRETRGDSLKLEFQDAFCGKKVQDAEVDDAVDPMCREGASQSRCADM